jgi:hypothetical protein
LKISVVRLALIGPAASWKIGARSIKSTRPSSGERQLDERRHQIVSGFSPVEARVCHQDDEAADGQRQHARARIQ